MKGWNAERSGLKVELWTPLYSCGLLIPSPTLYGLSISALPLLSFFLFVISSSFQFPGWSQGPEGSLVIALGNEDALGEYSCTPYNSLGTAGPSPVTRVLLKVTLRVGQQQWVRWLKMHPMWTLG